MREELNILKDFPPTPHETWLAAVDKQLKGRPFEKALVKQTYEGIGIRPMYFKHDLEGLAHADTLPGFPPYVRGNRPLGNRSFPWQVAQEILEPDPGALNRAIREDLARGQDTINLRLDRAGMAGENPDKADPPTVGAGGLSLATPMDWARVLEGIDPGRVPVQIDAGPWALAALASMVPALEAKGGFPETLKGCMGLDPLGWLAREGRLPYSFERAYDQMADLTRWAGEHAPKLRTMEIKTLSYADAGGTAVHELAFAAATGTAYVRQMQARGLDMDTICPRIQFTLSIGPDFFMEIAKFRAARMIWYNIATAFGAAPENARIFIHGRTQTYNKTIVDPWVNMLRVSTEAFSGIAGGCDSLHIGPFDEVARMPDEFSRRIARNVQTILKEESHFDKVTDPAGGSWYVENLTLDLAKKAWEFFQKVEGQGGMAKALELGVAQEEVAGTAALRAKNTATRKERVVGVNMYPNLTETPLAEREFDHERFQKDRARQMAEDLKPGEAPGSALEALGTGENPMETAVEAARAGASFGAIARALAGDSAGLSFSPMNIHRKSQPFEDLRREVETYKKRTGKAPAVFMANMGPLARHKPRSDFSTAFFNVGAFETLFNTGFDTPDQAVEAALKARARAVVICGTDADYMEVVVPITEKIKGADSSILVIVAGFSKDYVDIFKNAGVDEFIHLKADALAVLTRLQAHLTGRGGNQ